MVKEPMTFAFDDIFVLSLVSPAHHFVVYIDASNIMQIKKFTVVNECVKRS